MAIIGGSLGLVCDQARSAATVSLTVTGLLAQRRRRRRRPSRYIYIWDLMYIMGPMIPAQQQAGWDLTGKSVKDGDTIYY